MLNLVFTRLVLSCNFLFHFFALCLYIYPTQSRITFHKAGDICKPYFVCQKRSSVKEQYFMFRLPWLLYCAFHWTLTKTSLVFLCTSPLKTWCESRSQTHGSVFISILKNTAFRPGWIFLFSCRSVRLKIFLWIFYD